MQSSKNEYPQDKKNFVKGSYCLIYSRSKDKWYDAKITSIDGENKHEWLTVKYGNKRKKSKKIQRACKDIKPIPLDHAIFFKIGSHCEIYSRSIFCDEWRNGKVINIYHDDDGEWLTIKYSENIHNSNIKATKICDIQRYSKDIKLLLNCSDEYIEKKNKCYYVGSNFFGQLGNGTGKNLRTFLADSITSKDELTEIITLPDEAIIDIKTGRDNVYYLLANNECFVAGNNDKQQLLTTNEILRKICFTWSKKQFTWDLCHIILLYVGGKSDMISCDVILSTMCIHEHVKYISNGVVSDHRFIINNNNNKLYGVGNNHSLQFNIGDINSYDIEMDINTLNFVCIDYFEENNIELSQIHCSMGYSMFLTTRGELLVCGSSSGGGLGIGEMQKSNGIKVITMNCDLQLSDVDAYISDLTLNCNLYSLSGVGASCWAGKKIKDICCGCDHSLALTENLKVFSWGWNGNGQLGLNHKHDMDSPQLITNLKDKDIIMISCGYQHNLVLDKFQNIYSFGDNYYSQCAITNNINSANICIPTQINLLNDNNRINIIKIKCGAYHNVIYSRIKNKKNTNSNIEFYLWGHNNYNQCLIFDKNEIIVDNPTKFDHYLQYIGVDYKIIDIFPGNSETRIVTKGI